MADWCAARGLDLAPHGKTTMAPQLWAEQFDAGAWGITVADQAQLAVARAFGVSRTMVANAVVSPLGLRWIADQLTEDPDSEIIVWADSVRTVELMHAALAEHTRRVGARRPIAVLVEWGATGGRTGARDLETAFGRRAGRSSTRRTSRWPASPDTRVRWPTLPTRTACRSSAPTCETWSRCTGN